MLPLETLGKMVQAGSFAFIRARAQVVMTAAFIVDPACERGVTVAEMAKKTGLSVDTIRLAFLDIEHNGHGRLERSAGGKNHPNRLFLKV